VLSPTIFASLWVPPKPGMIPRLISGWPKLADVARHRQLAAAPESERVDRGDRHLSGLFHPPHHAVAALEQLHPGLGIGHLRELLDVGARGEDREGRGRDHDGADRCLGLDVVPDRGQIADHLRRDRVGGRTVEPQDRGVAARLEQDRLLLLEPVVWLGVSEEALASLAAEPPLADQPPEDERDRETLTPLPLRRRELLEDGVETRLVGACQRSRQDPGAHHQAELDVLGGRDALVDQPGGLRERLEPEPLYDARLLCRSLHRPS
jgi:hypothetical protein